MFHYLLEYVTAHLCKIKLLNDVLKASASKHKQLLP